MKLGAQLSKVANQLEYEKKRDLKGPKDALEKLIADDEERLEELKAKDKEARTLDQSTQKQIDKLKEKNDELKKQAEDADITIKTYKKRLSDEVSASTRIHKELTAQVDWLSNTGLTYAGNSY